jgi:hypothetical protein
MTMRNFILFCLLLNALIACNNNKGKGTGTEAAKGDSAQASMPASEADAIQKTMDQMKQLKPLSAEQVKALFPQELAGMKQSNYSPANNEGYETGEARYESGDGKAMDITVFDCAGEAGAGKYNIMYVVYLNTESEDENGYKKSIRFNGDKAIESFDKKQGRYSVLFLSGDRLLVNVEGENMTLEEVKQAASNLNLK